MRFWIPLVSIQNAVYFHLHGTAVPPAARPQKRLYRWEQHPVCLECECEYECECVFLFGDRLLTGRIFLSGW